MTDLSEAVLLGDRVGPTLDRRARDLDRPPTCAADQMMMVARRATAVRRLTLVGSDGVEITCIGHELQRPIDRGQADAFAVMAQIVVNLLGGPEVMSIRQDLLDGGPLPGLALRTRRLGRRIRFRDRPSCHLDAPRRPRPGGSVLIVVIGMRCMPMSFMDEVSVVAVLHCRMPAAWRMAMRVALGDRVRGEQLIIIDRLRQYGRGASAAQQVGEGPTQHEDRDGQQHDECTWRRVQVERAHGAANRRGDTDGDSAERGPR